MFVFVKGSRKRNVKIWIDFRKSPRFSLILPLSQEREKSSRPATFALMYAWQRQRIDPTNLLKNACGILFQMRINAGPITAKFTG